MADGKLCTAEEIERLSPDERNEIIRAGIVTDLSHVPEAFLKRACANVLEHLASTESATTSDQ